MKSLLFISRKREASSNNPALSKSLTAILGILDVKNDPQLSDQDRLIRALLYLQSLNTSKYSLFSNTIFADKLRQEKMQVLDQAMLKTHPLPNNIYKPSFISLKDPLVDKTLTALHSFLMQTYLQPVWQEHFNAEGEMSLPVLSEWQETMAAPIPKDKLKSNLLDFKRGATIEGAASNDETGACADMPQKLKLLFKK